MPIAKHYGGHGREVMGSMMKQYGKEAGKRVFYATENKRKMTPKRRKNLMGALSGSRH